MQADLSKHFTLDAVHELDWATHQSLKEITLKQYLNLMHKSKNALTELLSKFGYSAAQLDVGWRDDDRIREICVEASAYLPSKKGVFDIRNWKN